MTNDTWEQVMQLRQLQRENQALRAALAERDTLLRQIARLNPLRRMTHSNERCYFGCDFWVPEEVPEKAQRQAHVLSSPNCLWVRAGVRQYVDAGSWQPTRQRGDD